MQAYEPLRIPPRAARLRAEARRIGAAVNGEVFPVEDRLAVHVRHRHLRRRDQIQVGVFDVVHILREFRKLARALHGFLVRHKRGDHLRVTVLLRVRVEHEVHHRALQPRAQPFIEHKAAARHLCAKLRVEDIEGRAQIPVGLWLEIEFRGFHKFPDFHIVAVVRARRDARVRTVGDRHHQLVQMRGHNLQLRVVILDLRGKLFHLHHNGRNVLAVFLHDGDFLGDFVPLRL